MGDISIPVTSFDRTMKAIEETKADKVLLQAEQQDSLSGIDSDMRDNINPFAKGRASRKEELGDRARTTTKAELAKEKGESMLPVEALKNAADQFEEQNPELKSKVLVFLRQQIKPGDKAEDILRKVKEFYNDVTLVDEALRYLLDTTEGELHAQVQAAKEMLNEEFQREIAAGRNIGVAVREASGKEGLGTPNTLRDLYRDITANPRESNTLFNELSTKYAYKDMQKVINFLLHSVGSDLQSSGPSIPPGLLHNLLQETRALQAILGVYNFFNGRMRLVKSQFEKNGLQLPKELTFEQIAKQFMALVGDRYPSGDKVLQTAVKLGIDKWIMAKIIALSQLRDAIREVALQQVYRSVQHRDELHAAIIAALESLEEELDELLERESEDEEDEDEEDEDF